MVEQTLSFVQLTAGMARCVREWILPHLTDAMARLEAEQLAALIESLPRSFGAAAKESIRADTEEARAVLARFGQSVPAGADDSIEGLMQENAALKTQLMSIADRLRAQASAAAQQQLAELQQFFVRSLDRELGGTVTEDFVSMTSKESKARKK